MIRVVAALLFRQGKILIAQRPQGQSFAFKWEFPGGKVEPGEDDQKALGRELREELGITVQVGKLETEFLHRYPKFTVHLAFYHCTCDEDQFPKAHEHAQIEWVNPAALAQYDFLEADGAIVKKLSEIG